MIKVLFKLLLIVVGLYLAVQVPFIRQQVDGFKASLLEKIGNVTTEYDRVKGQVGEAEKTVNKIKDEVGNATARFNELKTQVIQTKDALNEAAVKVNGVLKVINGSNAEAAPATK